MKFLVKCYHAEQGVVELELEADSAQEVGGKVAGLGYRLVTISGTAKGTGGRQPAFTTTLFCQELLGLLAAGLNLVESLEALAERSRHTSGRVVVEGLLAALGRGERLAQAMERYPRAFPVLLVASIRASETTGNIPAALRQYLDYRLRAEAIGKKLISALIYPALLLGVGALVILFLLSYVIPRFSLVYDDIHTELPLGSRLLMAWGHWVSAHAAISAGLAGGLVVISLVALSSREVRSQLMAAVWRIRWFGDKLRIYELSRLYRTLAMLLNGGIPLVSAMDMVGDLLRPSLALHLQATRRDIASGDIPSLAFERHGLATDLARRLIRVGERSGELGDMLERTAALHDEELGFWVERFGRVFEPILMAVIGVVIGGIVLLMYMPIFGLVEAMQ